MADESHHPCPGLNSTQGCKNKNKWYSFTPWIENGEVAAIVKQKAR